MDEPPTYADRVRTALAMQDAGYQATVNNNYVDGLLAEHDRMRRALRRIVSLEEKNVPKYAQEIAKTALSSR